MAKRISPIRFHYNLDKWRSRTALGAAISKECLGSTYGEEGFDWLWQIDVFFLNWTLSLYWRWKADAPS